MGDRSCDACVHAKVTCMWPTTGSLWQVCFGCQQSHGKCEIGGKPVMARGLCKKRKVVSKATIKGDEDDAAWVPPPTPNVTRTAELPLLKQGHRGYCEGNEGEPEELGEDRAGNT